MSSSADHMQCIVSDCMLTAMYVLLLKHPSAPPYTHTLCLQARETALLLRRSTCPPLVCLWRSSQATTVSHIVPCAV